MEFGKKLKAKAKQLVQVKEKCQSTSKQLDSTLKPLRSIHDKPTQLSDKSNLTPVLDASTLQASQHLTPSSTPSECSFEKPKQHLHLQAKAAKIKRQINKLYPNRNGYDQKSREKLMVIEFMESLPQQLQMKLQNENFTTLEQVLRKVSETQNIDEDIELGSEGRVSTEIQTLPSFNHPFNQQTPSIDMTTTE